MVPCLPRVITVGRAAALRVTRSRVRTEIKRGNWQRLAANVNAVRALVTRTVARRLCTVEELVKEYRTGPRLRAGVEVDSRKHHLGPGDWEATLGRHPPLINRACRSLCDHQALLIRQDVG